MLAIAALVASLSTPLAEAAPIPDVRLERVFATQKFTRPTQILQRPDDEDLLYILEQGGRIKSVRRSQERLRPDEKSGAPAPVSLFMDIDDRVDFSSNEEGLLSMAFHPRFAENREFFVYYSVEKPRHTTLSRFRAVERDGALVGDPKSEEILLEVAQPYWNHKGGTVLFGPDRMLYLSLGDGGAANDPHSNGQNLKSLLAKVIRIDVDAPPADRAAGKRYAVPKDNPFVGRSDAMPEIWAYGLRNIWRMSFDRTGGALWGGDVGQNKWEEIDRIERGGNYGWNLREGMHPFSRGGERQGDTRDPVAEYGRSDGLSVTGGHVYRGAAHPALQGVYLYADYSFGTIWGFRVDAPPPVAPRVLLKKRGSLIASFGECNDGEIYVATFEGGEQGPGAIYRLRATER